MKFCTKALSLLLFLLLYGSFQIAAQKATTDTNSFPVDSTKFFTFTEDNFAYGKFSIFSTQLTNQLDNFQNYRERHPNTGNAGAPQKDLFIPKLSTETFRSRPGSFNYFGYGKENRKFYDSEKPYTKIQLVLGQKEELNVGVTHAHPFGKNCNVALGFDRVRSAGFYQRQNTNNTSVNLNGWYRAPGKRYALLADVYWTTIKVAENGGIVNDSDFQFATQLDRRIVQVNLSAAENRQRTRGAWVKQYWSFGAIADTISDINDSLNYRTKIYPSWAIVHTIGISDEKYVYYDRNPRAGFYANVLRDTLVTDDSTYTWKVENGLWLERFQLHDQGKTRKVFGRIGVRHESGEYFNDTIYKPFSNFLVDGNLDFARLNFMPDANLKGWVVLNGYNKGDYFVHAHVVKRARYGIAAEQKRQHPDFIYSHYSGNHFAWINDFFPSTQTDISATALKFFGNSSLVAMTAGFHNYAKPVYFDENYLPAQLPGSVNAFSGRIYVSLGTKSLKSKTDFSWNKLPANSPIRLPEFVVRESVYGNFRLFKKALLLQAGVDATWLSAFYGDAYNPNISQFYIQNLKEIGNYVFIDAWVSIKIKPVRIFVKADHVNAGLFGRNYYLIPGYPQNDFALKFGLSWVFND
ncbi:MAG: putative porin [Bacteroidota bacterium]|nr:putative porin [Bacteroidota bacterium]